MLYVEAISIHEHLNKPMVEVTVVVNDLCQQEQKRHSKDSKRTWFDLTSWNHLSLASNDLELTWLSPGYKRSIQIGQLRILPDKLGYNNVLTTKFPCELR